MFFKRIASGDRINIACIERVFVDPNPKRGKWTVKCFTVNGHTHDLGLFDSRTAAESFRDDFVSVDGFASVEGISSETKPGEADASAAKSSAQPVTTSDEPVIGDVATEATTKGRKKNS